MGYWTNLTYNMLTPEQVSREQGLLGQTQQGFIDKYSKIPTGVSGLNPLDAAMRAWKTEQGMEAGGPGDPSYLSEYANKRLSLFPDTTSPEYFSEITGGDYNKTFGDKYGWIPAAIGAAVIGGGAGVTGGFGGAGGAGAGTAGASGAGLAELSGVGAGTLTAEAGGMGTVIGTTAGTAGNMFSAEDLIAIEGAGPAGTASGAGSLFGGYGPVESSVLPTLEGTTIPESLIPKGGPPQMPTTTQAPTQVPWYEQIVKKVGDNWPSLGLFGAGTVLDYFNSQNKAEQGKGVASQYLNQLTAEQQAYQDRLNTSYQNALNQTDTNYDQYLKSYADVKEAAKPDIPGYTTALQGIISEQSEAAKRKAAEKAGESGSGGGSYQKALDTIQRQGLETAARGLQPFYSGYSLPMPSLKPTVTQQTAGPVSPSYDALTALNASGTSDWLSRALGLGGQMLRQQQLMDMIRAMNKN